VSEVGDRAAIALSIVIIFVGFPARILPHSLKTSTGRNADMNYCKQPFERNLASGRGGTFFLTSLFIERFDRWSKAQPKPHL
jgi:hypothetical protein